MHENCSLEGSKKSLLMAIGPNRGGIRRLSVEKDIFFQKCLIDPDREKNSASNEYIFNHF